MKKELTCIICPQGCNIKVEIEGNNIINVEGNGCKRGYEYAISEVKNPVRTLTTTIKLQNGKVIPVKTFFKIWQLNAKRLFIVPHFYYLFLTFVAF